MDTIMVKCNIIYTIYITYVWERSKGVDGQGNVTNVNIEDSRDMGKNKNT